jgi:hypothetical protein
MMKQHIGIFFVLISLSGCGGGSDEDSINVNKSAITIEGTWQKYKESKGYDTFVVKHSEGLYAQVSPSNADLNKISIITMDAQPTHTDFKVEANFNTITPGEHQFPVDINLYNKSQQITATQRFNITVRVSDKLEVTSSAGKPYAIPAIYNQQQDASFNNIYIETYGYEYQITDSNGLLNYSIQSGKGSNNVLVTYKPQLNKVGLQTTELRVTTSDKKLTATYPVTIDIDKPRWSFAQPGLLFSQFADSSKLTTSTKLQTTKMMPTNTFSVSTNTAWLQANIVDDQLTATVTPRGLEAGLHHAEITVKSSDIAEKPEQKLAVSFYYDPERSHTANNFRINKESPAYYTFGAYVAVPGISKLELFNAFTGNLELEINLLGTPLSISSAFPLISEDGRFIQLQRQNESTVERVQYDLINKQWLAPEPSHRSTDSDMNFVRLDLVDLMSSGPWDNWMLSNNKFLTVYENPSVPRLELSKSIVLDQNKILDLTQNVSNGNYDTYDYKLVEVSLQKSAGAMFYDRLLSTGKLTGGYKTLLLENNLLAMLHSETNVWHLYKFAKDGSMTETLMPIAFKNGFTNSYSSVLCSIDEQTFYQINTFIGDKEYTYIDKISIDGKLLASATIAYGEQLQNCKVLQGNQMLSINFDRFVYSYVEMLSPL